MTMTAVVLMFTACGTQKKAVDKGNPIVDTDSLSSKEFLDMVHATNAPMTQYVTSKVKFTIETGPQKVSLTGNLSMKRDDVIRLQLMAFGFVEAGRMEFTKDYVLIIDRINKQYLQAPYNYVEFLRNSGINFFTLQALFWNELFIPGKENVEERHLRNFTTEMGGDEAVIYLEDGKINYSWLTNQKTGRIKMTNIMYRDPYNGNTQLNWNYKDYSALNGKLFPSDMVATLTTPAKEVKMGIHLSYIKAGYDQWETRTKVSEKYRKVTADDLLKRLMSSL